MWQNRLMKETWDFLQRTLFSEDEDIRAEAWELAAVAVPLGVMFGYIWGHLTM